MRVHSIVLLASVLLWLPLSAEDVVEVQSGAVTINGTLALGATQAISGVSNDPALTANAADQVPTQQAVKAYVDARTSPGGGDAMVPPGTLRLALVAAPPEGWLLCDGRAVPRDGDNAALFAALGTTYGDGDGTTTFNLPDARGRLMIGAGGAPDAPTPAADPSAGHGGGPPPGRGGGGASGPPSRAVPTLAVHLFIKR